MKRRNIPVVAEVSVLVAVYFAAAKLGLSLAFLNGSVSPVWPPTGVAIAALMLLGYRATPGIALGAFLANYLLTPVGVVTAAGIASGNTLEAVTAIYLLRMFVKQDRFFHRAADVLKFVLVAAILSPMVAATIGNLCLILSGAELPHTFGTLWLTWWSGDGVGALVVTPLILTWVKRSPEQWSSRRAMEAVLLGAALIIVELLLFTNFFSFPSKRYPLGHFAIPLLIWAAFRFGPRGVATSIAMLSVIAVWGTTRSVGPFADANTNQALLLLQAFVADLAITSFVLAAIVAESRRAQRAVSFAASIVDSTDDVVIGKDLDGKIRSWNKAAERIYGYRAEEVIGRHISILLPDDRPDDIQQIMATLKGGGRIVNYETIRATKDGREINVSLTISPIRSAAGEVAHASTIARDITERKRSEQALFESREWLRMTMVGGRMGTWTRDLDGGNRVMWSPELESIFGLEPGEFAGTEEAFLSFVHPEDRERLLTAVRRSIENRTDYDVEFRYTPKGGGTGWMLGRGRAFYDATGKPYRLAGLGMDITERKQAEEERQRLLSREQAARAEAESANRIKDEFLATVSHELRTPLNAIVGWTSMLRSDRLEPDQIAHAIEIIDRNAKAQAQLVDDILEVSRIVSGKVRLEVRPVELSQVIQGAIDSMRPAIESRKIQLTTVIDKTVGPVLGDADRLQQIVWNLLSNAVKFTPLDGRVEVQLRGIDSQVEIIVTDNGEGISPDFLPHVFDRFLQADGTITRQHKGLGLGLAIVRHLVELHGGSVHAESAGVGTGATFSVSFPLLTGSEESESDLAGLQVSEKSGSASLKGLRILVVDDEQDARELVSTILQSVGANVRAVASAHEALAELREWLPDVLISDLEMPGEDGYSLIRQVRKLSAARGGSTLAVALTAHARAEDCEESLNAGFQLHVAKPVEPAKLMHALISLTENHHKAY